MTRWPRLLPVLAVLSCSGLDQGEGGVVALEVEVPVPPTVEVGDTLQLHAIALDANGDPVDAAISWTAADPTLTVNATGLVTGVSPGNGRVQAREGSLASNVVSLGVVARADTLLLVGDSIRTIPADSGNSGDLVTELRTFTPEGPVEGHAVTYDITYPVGGTTPGVTLTGGAQTATVSTGIDGTVVGMRLIHVPGQPPVDSAVVTVSAERTRGAPVPGSGQRFVIRFE
ncbi:MAG TPA: Ig-like domain-containing protein [Gemmatimonadales bacterium]|nr:Ig-like domain-containing protein [Gemmatimonadales bacterium]